MAGAVLLIIPFTLAHGGEAHDGPARRGEAVLFAHIVLMLASWWLLLPLGVILANRGRGADTESRLARWRSVSLGPAWFKLHLHFQYGGWLLQLAGFVCSVVYVQEHGTFGHFAGPHEAIGLVVVLLGSLQPLNAFLRPHAAADGEKRSRARAVWEVLHKGVGYGCLVGGIVAAPIGYNYLDYLGYDSVTQSAALGLMLALGATCLAVLSVSFTSAWPAVFSGLAKAAA